MNIGTRDAEFGVKEEGDILRICVDIEHAASLVLMGAGGGKYNKFFGSTYSYHGNPNEGRGDNNQNQMLLDNKPRMGKIKELLFGGKQKTTNYGG